MFYEGMHYFLCLFACLLSLSKVTTRKQLQIAVEQFQKEMLDPVNVQSMDLMNEKRHLSSPSL